MERPENEPMDAATDCAWGMFEDALIMGLGRIGQGEVLALIAPTGPGGWAAQLVIRADTERGGMWVARGIAGSTAADEVVARVGRGGSAELASAIVRQAREEMRLPHPQLFTAAATGPGAALLAEQLGLTAAADMTDRYAGTGDGPRGVEGRDGVVVGGPDDLRPLAAAVVRDVVGQDPGVDDDGDLTFHVDGSPAYVIFSRDGSAVQLSAMVVRGIYSRRNTAVEVDLLNRKGLWNTWFMNGREVYLRSTVPALPLTADNLGRALRVFGHELCTTREELAYRLGGVAA